MALSLLKVKLSDLSGHMGWSGRILVTVLPPVVATLNWSQHSCDQVEANALYGVAYEEVVVVVLHPDVVVGTGLLDLVPQYVV